MTEERVREIVYEIFDGILAELLPVRSTKASSKPAEYEILYEGPGRFDIDGTMPVVDVPDAWDTVPDPPPGGEDVHITIRKLKA